MARPFTIDVWSPQLPSELRLASGADFKLGDNALDSLFGISLPPRERDLLRIAMAVYVADRRVRRPRLGQEGCPSRTIELTVDVTDPDFWSDRDALGLLTAPLTRLGGDFWTFSFRACPPAHQQFPLFREAGRVALYSTGLDSLAGLAATLREDRLPVVTVTALHQALRRRADEQLNALANHFHVPIRPVYCWTRLSSPPKLSSQESTQRYRGFLFTTLAGVVASSTGASQVEVFENGIGAINLPPQLGMCLGSMATKGCHPGFLSAMSRLMSHVASRAIQYRLPMIGLTKAEAVSGLVREGLGHLALQTVSCSHYPIRRIGPAKQCGTCFACLGRRQAMLCAGIPDDPRCYELDLFGPHDNSVYQGDRLDPLKACLKQAVELVGLKSGPRALHAFERHVVSAGIADHGLQLDDLIELHDRYAREWVQLICRCQALGLPWARWVRPRAVAA